jgi:hypothetical protein
MNEMKESMMSPTKLSFMHRSLSRDPIHGSAKHVKSLWNFKELRAADQPREIA